MCKKTKQLKQNLASRVKIVNQVYRDPYTFVELSLDGLLTCGFAKRNPVDKPDSRLGFRIAFGRALHELAILCKSSL